MEPSAITPQNIALAPSPTSPSSPVRRLLNLILSHPKRSGLILASIALLSLLGLYLIYNQFNQRSSTGSTPSITPTAYPGKLAYIQKDQLVIYNLATQQTLTTVDLPLLSLFPDEILVHKLAWSADGQLLALLFQPQSQTNSTLQIFKLADRQLLSVFETGAAGPIYDFVWIPQTNELLISYPVPETSQIKYRLSQRSVLGFPETKNIVEWVRPIQKLVVTTSGFIYFLDQENELWQANLAGGRFIPILRGIDSFDLSDDERQLVYQRVTEQEIWVGNFDGQNAKQITFTSPERQNTYGEGGRTNPQWSPDHQTILFTESALNFQTFGLVNSDGTNLRSLEKNSVAPRLKYNQIYQRDLTNFIWLDNHQILFIGQTNDATIPNNLYISNLDDNTYTEILTNINQVAWSRL